MPLSITTLNATKELAVTGQPLILAAVAFRDGSSLYLSTHNVEYGGHAYQQRIQEQDLQAIIGAGVASLPAVTITLSDGDRAMFAQEIAHGFKGADLTLRLVMWEVYTSTFTSDSRVIFSGICDGTSSTADGRMTITARTRQLARSFFPQVRLQRNCPWAFPPDAAARTAAATDPSSPFYRCGYSPANGAGTGSYTDCQYTRAACIARGMLNASTGVGNFGGITWQPPKSWRSRSYLEKQFIDGVNAGPDALYGSYVPEVYGTAWVNGKVTNVVGDGNSTRGEVIVCLGYVGSSGVQRVIVNDFEVPKAGPGVDPLFRWNWINQGGKTGTPNADAGFDSKGDAYGSMAAIEIVVFRKVTDDLRRSQVRVLVTGPEVRVYSDGSTYSGAQTDNASWVVMDLLTKTDFDYADLDIAAFIAKAAICGASVTYTDQFSSSSTHIRFGCSLVLDTRRPASEVIPAVLEGFGGYLYQNDNGKLALGIKGTLAEEQPSAVSGSNYNTPISSKNRAGSTVSGYAAYSFDESNIIDGVAVSTPSIADSPNRVAFSFVNRDNQFIEDTFAPVDAQDVARVGQEVTGNIAAMGINSLDQAKRAYARWDAERLRGNSAGDTRGTLRFTFRSSIKAAHLHVGHIIRFTWAQFSISGQLLRITQIRPGRNAEEITIQADWHNDNWYLDSYGQSADGGYSNPGKERTGLPQAWEPLEEGVPGDDPLFTPDAMTFGLTPTYEATGDGVIARLEIRGNLPVNKLSDLIQAPYTPLQGTYSAGPGTIDGGQTIYVSVAGEDANGRLSAASSPPARFDLPAGTNYELTLSGIKWPQPATKYHTYIGNDPTRMVELGVGDPGSPSSVTVASFVRSGYAPPDPAFERFAIRVKRVLHSGVWGAAVTSVAPNQITIAGAGWADNEWIGRDVSVLSSGAGFPLRVLNFEVGGNDAETLSVTPDPDGILSTGDVLVMRCKPAVSGLTLTDAKWENGLSNNGDGLALDGDKGKLLLIIAGTGAGYAYPIASNNSVAHTIVGPWFITPDTSSRYIIVDPAEVLNVKTDPFNNDRQVAPTYLAVDVSNYKQSVLLVQVDSLSADGTANLYGSPFREIYLPGDPGQSGGAQTIQIAYED